VRTRCLQIRNASFNFREARVDQLGHVLARTFAAVTDTENAPDLVKREACGLGMADERQPVNDSWLVIPVARSGSRRQRKDGRLFQKRMVLADTPAWAASSPIFTMSSPPLTLQSNGRFSLAREWA